MAGAVRAESTKASWSAQIFAEHSTWGSSPAVVQEEPRSQSTQGMSKGSSAVVLPEPHGFLYCCDKRPKGNLERKGFVQLIYTFSHTNHSPSLKESKVGTLRQELRDHRGISLTGLLLLASSVYIPGSTAHGQNCPKELDPSTSVISQENDPQSCTRACFKEAFCLVEFPS